MKRFLFLSIGAIALMQITAANAAVYVIKMKFNQDTGKLNFERASLKIQPGDTVTWVQDDPDNEHNVVAYPSRIPAGTKPFQGPMLKMGTKWSMTFTKVGTYEYHCHPHEAVGMRGTIIVGRASRPDEFRKAKAGEHEHGHHGDNMRKHHQPSSE